MPGAGDSLCQLAHRRFGPCYGVPRGSGTLKEGYDVTRLRLIAATYEQVENLSPLLVGKATIGAIAVPMVLPRLVVATQQVPLRDMLLKLLKTLV